MTAFMNNVMKNFLSQLIIKNVYVVKNENINYIVQIEYYRYTVYVNIYMGMYMLTCLNTPTSILVQKWHFVGLV